MALSPVDTSPTLVTHVSVVGSTVKKNVHQPRLRATINGTLIALLDGTVTKNGHFTASTFSGRCVVWLRDVEQWLSEGVDGNRVPVTVERGEVAPDNTVDWETVFSGVLDSEKLTLHEGVCQFDCRDWSALLIDNKLYATYQNKTVAEIITKLCSDQGLTANVKGAQTLAGTIYAKDHTKIKHGEFSRAQTSWDLICELARSTGNIVKMDGKTLYVMPDEPDESDPWIIYYTAPTFDKNGNVVAYPNSNVIGFELDRNLLATKDIKVVVKSFHSGRGKGFSVSAGGSSKGDGQSVYERYYPNLTHDAAQQKANELYKQLTSHELVLEVDAVANWNVEPYRTVKIQGASGTLDQTYYVDQVSFTVTQDEGSVMKVRIKNHPLVSEATV